MSGDIFSLVDNAHLVVDDVVFVFLSIRAIEMGKGFVNPVYRSRAYWSAALFSVAVLNDVASNIPIPNAVVVGLLTFLTFILLIVTILVFVDRSILVAISTDFFHRSIIGWSRWRRWVFVALVLSSISLFAASIALPNNENFPTAGDSILLLVGFWQFIIVIPVSFAYAAAALIIGARRTPDLSLKGNFRFLGLALALFVASFVVSGVTNDVVPFDLANDALSLASVYLLYRSVMSLSTIGRVGKEAPEVPVPKISLPAAPPS
jgi:hypothetical protein